MSTPVVRVELKRANAVDVLSTDADLKQQPLVRELLALPGKLDGAVFRRFAVGGVVWQQGDEGDALLLVVGGAARLFARRDKDNAELGLAQKGEVLGERAALTGERKRAYSAVAHAQLDVLEVPRALLLVNGALPPGLSKLLQLVQTQRAAALDELSDFLNRW